jgi:hypothetical protein
MADKKWIQKAIKKPGALRKEMGAKEGEPIPQEKLDAKKAELERAKEKKGKLTDTQRRLLRRINLAETLKGLST